MQSYLNRTATQTPTRNLYIACINSPVNVTVSGDEVAIDSLKAKLDADHIPAHKLKTGVAYHSPHMEKIASEYASSLEDLRCGKSTASGNVVMISSVTGEPIRNLDIVSSSEYWVNNMVRPVRFLQAVERAISQTGQKRKLGAVKQSPIFDFIEVGPHSAMRRPTLSILERGAPKAGVRYSSVLIRRQNALTTTLELVGRLHCLGYRVALEKVNQTKAPYVSGHPLLVDLPEYPFNHSRIYWHESNISMNSRLRKHPRHELLGTAVPDWNPLEPRWRKFFDIGETPWVDDHQVNGRPIYPATGMIVMAIEGAKQVAEPGRTISGYQVKDAIFSHPISMSAMERVEVQLFLRPIHNSSEKDSSTSDYRICIRKGDEWQENCRGTIQVQYETARGELDSFEKDDLRAQYYRTRYEEAVASCTQPVKTEQMYQHFVSNGLTYGPAFQALDELAWDGNHNAIGKLKTFKWTREQSRHSRQAHVVHPTTLDAAGQLMWVGLTKGATEVLFNGAAVTRVQSAWISSSGLAHPEASELRAFSTSSLKGFRGTDSSMFALDQEGRLKMVFNHMETTAVLGNEVVSDQALPRQICFNMDWRPDPDMLTYDELVSYCKATHQVESEPTEFYQNLGLVLFYFVQRTLTNIRDIDTTTMKPHLQKYVTWLMMQVARCESGQLPGAQSDWVSRSRDEEYMRTLMKRVEDTNTEGAFFVTVGRNIESIIRGTVDPLELMFESGLAEAQYQGVCDKISSCKQLAAYLDLIAHKSPSMKIVEVGAGTGSITDYVLSPLRFKEEETVGARFSQYDYTDISEAFFEQAQQRFAPMNAKMNFKALNIEKDPQGQGYEEGSYDLVVAAWVLHATCDLNATVKNVRKLLKPGGKLVLLEITKPDILRNGFAFGTLPGWWLSTEKHRQWGPCITEEQWHHILKENGFAGVDFVLPDYQSETCQESSIMIATAVEEVKHTTHKGRISILIDVTSSTQVAVAERIRQLRHLQGDVIADIVSISGLGELLISKEDTIIFLPELEDSFLYELNESRFSALQKALGSAQKLVWVTAKNRSDAMSPRKDMITGLARVLCTESSNMSFVTVSLRDHHEKVDIWAEKIAQVLNVSSSKTSGSRELEYVEAKDGKLMINRITEATRLNRDVHSKSTPTLKKQAFGQGPPLVLEVANPGFLDSLQFVEDQRFYTDIGSDEVEIEVKSVGVNFRDLLVVLGRFPADTVGCEVSGVITRVGSKCISFRPGNRVCAAIIGCIYSYARCNYQLAVKIPDSISFAQAASFPVTGVTAHYSLVTVANLQPDESILIHSGAGGTGQMAIQIAQSIGAEVFVTVGSKEKKQLLSEVYHIPDDHIFYSRDTSFAKDVMRMTSERGVDVVLNSLSGDNLVASWESVAPFGRFVELGKADIETNSKLPMACFAKNVSFNAVAVDHICANRPAMIQKMLMTVVKMVGEGELKIASPLHEFPISDIEGAFRSMQSGKNTGKMVLTFGEEDVVPVSSLLFLFS